MDATSADLLAAVPVPVVVEDWSSVGGELTALRQRGVADIDHYFDMQCGDHDELGKLYSLVHVVDANGAAQRLLEAHSSAQILANERTLLPLDRASHRAVCKAIFENQAECRGERTLISVSGRKVLIAWRCSLNPDTNDYRRLCFYGFDVAGLGEQHGADAVSLAKQTRSASVSLSAELAATLLHEISQPLAGAKLSTDAALRWLSRDPPERAEATSAIREAGRRAVDAIDMCRKIRAHLSRSAAHAATFNAAEAVAAALLAVAPDARATHICLSSDVAPGTQAFADPLQIQQVLVALLLNGIDAIASGSAQRRELRVAVRHGDAGATLFEVHDTGSGIEHDMLGSIFEPFFTTRADRLGMGLAVAQFIVESYGGRVWADSIAAHGTWMRFTLPAQTPA
jgi:two-component system, LuxR family, sensor kinase FixL